MKTKTIRAGALLAVTVCALALTGCAPGAGSSTTTQKVDDTKITIWNSYAGAQGAVIASYTKQFQAAHPKTKVNLVNIDTPDLKQKIQSALVAGNLPDVIQYYGGASMQPLVKAKQLVALNPYIAKSAAWNSNLVSGWSNNYTFGGKIYGVPAESPVVEMYYNKDVLSEAGIDTPPTTFKQLLTAVTKLNAAGITPISLEGKDGWPAQLWMQYLAMRYGGPDLFADALSGKKSWTDPAFLQGATAFEQLIQAKAFSQGFLADGYDQQSARYTGGKAGFVLDGTWFLGTLVGAPAALKSTSFVPFPTVAGGSGKATDAEGGPNASFSVTSNAGDKQLAWDYVKGLTSEKTAAQVAEKAIALVPNKVTLSSTSPQLLKAIVAKVPTYSFSQFWNDLLSPSANTEYVNLQNEMIAGQLTPQQMVDQFAAYMKEKN